jgi:hypothetical protein
VEDVDGTFSTAGATCGELRYGLGTQRHFSGFAHGKTIMDGRTIMNGRTIGMGGGL